MSEFSSSDDEGGPTLPVSREPDDQLFADVKAFAAGLGFSSKGEGNAGMASTDDPAFDDFAPEKAKKKLEKKPNNNLSKEGKNDANAKGDDDGGKSDGAAAAAGEKAPPLKARPEDPPKFKFDPIPEYQKDGAPPRSLLKNTEGGRWYENTTAAVESNGNGAAASKKSGKIDLAGIETQRQRGLELISAETAAFEASAGRQKGGVGSNLQWLQQAQRGGTTSDKVAAMALLVQEAPVANLRSLDALINMAAKRGGARAVVGTALDALKELWLEVLLPPDRKLKFFEQQPLTLLKAGKEGDTALLLWAFEDALKKRYAVFVDHVDHLSRDNLDFVKDRASKTAYDLLAARPEAEATLLSTLVNKLGDPSRKLASKVGYLLTTLLVAHPGMKAVVVREVERFAFRPGLADRARYYAVVFLNQMVLTHKDAPVAGVSLARRLVDVYFTLFKLVMEGKVGTAATLAAAKREKAKKEADARAARRGKKKTAVQKKKKDINDEDNDADKDNDIDEKEQESGEQHSGEMDARMLSALITGVRRAFPFVAAEEVEPLIEAHAGLSKNFIMIFFF
jgi:ribosome biogenesis protein MAK21